MDSSQGSHHLTKILFLLSTIILSWPVSAQSVGEILRTDKQLSIFANAMAKGDLWEAVDSSKSIIIFAPPDSAMIIEGSDFLLDKVLVTPSNHERLVELLSYHIVPGSMRDVKFNHKSLTLETLSHECLSLHQVGESLKIGPEAFVIGTLTGDNGMILLIDRLLWQPYDQTGCEPDLQG